MCHGHSKDMRQVEKFEFERDGHQNGKTDSCGQWKGSMCDHFISHHGDLRCLKDVIRDVSKSIGIVENKIKSIFAGT